MDDLDNIRNFYEKLADQKLLELSANPGELRLDVIPVLQKELLKRGRNEEALELTDYLVGKKSRLKYSEMSEKELKTHITEQLNSGVPIENIQIDLREAGINVYDLVEYESKMEEKAFNFITGLREQGLKESEIDEKLNIKLGIGKEESEYLKISLRKSGKRNVVFGYSILVIGVLLILLSFSLGGKVGIGAIVALAAGIWQIYHGKKQLQE